MVIDRPYLGWRCLGCTVLVPVPLSEYAIDTHGRLAIYLDTEISGTDRYKKRIKKELTMGISCGSKARSAYFLIVVICCLFGTAVAAAEPIHVSSTVYPPFSQPDHIPGKGNGVLYDLTVEAFRAVDLGVDIHFIPMARIVWSVIENKDQATLGTMNWFARVQKDHLVEVVDLVNANIVFFFKKERFPDGLTYERLSDLDKYRIGSVTGSSTLPILKEAGIKPQLVAELTQNFNKLNMGRIDLTVAVRPTGWIIINNMFPDKADTFSAIEKPLLTLKTSIAFLKDQSGLLQTFNKGLTIILENGTYYEVVTRYFGIDQDLREILPHDIYARMKKKASPCP